MLAIVRILRAEGFAEAVLALAVFAASGESWWLFAALILLPDVTIVAYVLGPRYGAIAYNAAHNHVAPALLGATAVAFGSVFWWAIAAIWLAHIGIDRALGYGLKLATFQETHLGRIGDAVE